MNKVFLVFTVLCLSMSCTKETIIEGAAGADGKDGRDGIDGQDGASITATVIDLAIGSEECPNGGSIVALFADGIQFDEIITCNGIDGQDGADGSYSIMTSNPYFVNNELTGEMVEYGIDDNGNDILDEDEVDGSFIILNGVDGADGADGTDGQDGADGADGQDGQDANGAGVYNWSGVWLDANTQWSLETSNIIYYPTQTNDSNGFRNNKYTADVSLFEEVINTTFSHSSTLGTYYSSAVFYFNVVDVDNREWVNGIHIRDIGTPSERITANHYSEVNGVVTLVAELVFLKQ